MLRRTLVSIVCCRVLIGAHTHGRKGAIASSDKKRHLISSHGCFYRLNMLKHFYFNFCVNSPRTVGMADTLRYSRPRPRRQLDGCMHVGDHGGAAAFSSARCVCVYGCVPPRRQELWRSSQERSQYVHLIMLIVKMDGTTFSRMPQRHRHSALQYLIFRAYVH